MIRAGLVFGLFILFIIGCNQGSIQNRGGEDDTAAVIQKGKGDISLRLKDAYLLYDEDYPERNTAEWRIEVCSSGRYEVWLSSLTRDTMNLSYNEPVIVTFGDDRIENQPVGNKIILDDIEKTSPYFRADSKIGSIFIDDPGHYNLQVISEKVLPESTSYDSHKPVHTILHHVILKSQTQ
ncbi:MAG: hypothetical protein K8R35_05240 [Bacteroidales bacterium]|nr:hypothetical protein [Bacteroidales bacterium]